jgi:uracil-DNA glycosylase
VKPEVIVCLGAVAAKALLGRTFSVMKSRGIS